MGKYKDGGKSIDVHSIAPKDMPEACLEWANGNKVMAEFLYTCYENGLETNGNHIGPHSYVDFHVNNSHRLIKQLLKYMDDIDGGRVVITPDGGNLMCDKFWEPILAIGFDDFKEIEDAEKVFGEMTEIIKNGSSEEIIEDGAFTPMLDIHDFFARKGSRLRFYANNNDGQYSFYISSGPVYDSEKIEYFKELFEKAGLSYEESGRDGKMAIHDWTLVSNGKEDFIEKVLKTEEIIEANWAYKKPTQIEEGMGVNEQATIKWDQFQTWLEEKREEYQRLMEEQMRKIKMQQLVEKAIDDGTTGEQVKKVDNAGDKGIQEQKTEEGVTQDD